MHFRIKKEPEIRKLQALLSYDNKIIYLLVLISNLSFRGSAFEIIC